MDQAIIDKIRKLLALATSSNEREARLAAEKASELLIRHNLKMQDLGEERAYKGAILRSGRRAAPHARYVMTILERHFFVAVIKVRLGPLYRTDIVVVGEPHNVEVARYVFAFLYRAFVELWEAAQARYRLPRKRQLQYYLGLTAGICMQLEAAKKRVEDDMALVVVPDPGLKDAVQNLIGDTHKGRKPKTRAHHGARMAGFVDGRNLRIRQGITERNEGPVRQIEGQV